MKVADRVIVVTGGGSGMGRELVLELLRRGAMVAAVDINETTLAETAALADAQHRERLATFTLSITDKAAVEALPQRVIDRFGHVDGVINNAGIIQPFVRLNDLDYTDIDRVMDVNFRGALYMTKAFLPILLKRPEAHIVNTSSMGGFLPVPGQTIYGASKAAVKLMTEGLWAELRGTRVHVTVVFPGAIATNITQNSGVDIPGDMSPEEMAKAAARTLPADKAARIILDGMQKNAYRIPGGLRCSTDGPAVSRLPARRHVLHHAPDEEPAQVARGSGKAAPDNSAAADDRDGLRVGIVARVSCQDSQVCGVTHVQTRTGWHGRPVALAERDDERAMQVYELRIAARDRPDLVVTADRQQRVKRPRDGRRVRLVAAADDRAAGQDDVLVSHR